MKTTKRRTVVKGVRLTRNERAAMALAARRSEMNVSDWMRARLLADLDIRGTDESQAERQLTLSLAKAAP